MFFVFAKNVALMLPSAKYLYGEGQHSGNTIDRKESGVRCPIYAQNV